MTDAMLLGNSKSTYGLVSQRSCIDCYSKVTYTKKIATIRLYLSPLRSSVSESDCPGLSLFNVRLPVSSVEKPLKSLTHFLDWSYH